MGRKGITYEQVEAVADALHAERPSSVTLAGVRARLGTGSPNTIHKLLKLWDENRPKTTAPIVSIPEEVTKALSTWVLQASTGSRAQSEERSVQAQAAADELARAGEELEVERDQLRDEIVALTTQRDQQQATANERGAEIQRLLAEVERERSLAGAAQVEAAGAKLRADSQVEHLTELRGRVDMLSASFESEREDRITAERDSAVVAAKLASARGELDAARDQVITLQQELALTRDQADEARRTFDARAQQDQARIDQLRQEHESRIDEHRRLLDQARAQLAAATVDKAQLQGQLAQLQGLPKE